ncbi:hypothetical protein EGM51_05230 [Verrucomicrobia bacterium S94]|nr:hypothetical protein EGM51_05230 [Verrucomicrobia bacterium S94]
MAGLLVVFSVVQKEEKKFVPPKPIDRPKMKLKKPKVKVKKSAKPRSTTRIVTKVQKASMPDIQLPEMSGIGEGLAGGDVAGFDIMPDMSDLTIFGTSQSIGNDFVGTFYDTKRLRSGTGNPGISIEETCEAIIKFVKNDWRPSVLNKYYRSPRKLYATTFTFPTMPAAMAPEAFGEADVPGYGWFAHYKGELVYPEDIKFRFWGQGDNAMIVRVGKEIVLVVAHPEGTPWQMTLPLWNPSDHSVYRKYALDKNFSVAGDWIELKAGEPVNMEVIVAVPSGGLNCFILCVEEEGKEYPENPFDGGPCLPVFKTEELSQDLKDEIIARSYEGDFDLDSGPIFRDYKTSDDPEPSSGDLADVKEEEPAPAPEPSLESYKGPRVWSTADGKTFEGEYVANIAGTVTIKPVKGRRNIKVPMSSLSEEDRAFIELSQPPRFNIDFIAKTRRLPALEVTPYWDAVTYEPDVNNTFGVRLKQESPAEYNYPLTVKYYAIGKETDGDKLVMLDQHEEVFIPSEQPGRIFEVLGDTIKTRAYSIKPGDRPIRGVRYSGNYLITVTDSRGVVVQHSESHSFLFDIRHKLDKLGRRHYFNEKGDRVTPTRPKLSQRSVPL